VDLTERVADVARHLAHESVGVLEILNLRTAIMTRFSNVQHQCCCVWGGCNSACV
jgi:hypothetical protein